MTLQIPALHTDDLDERLASRIEQRLMALADELEHSDVVAYGADRGLATRGGVVRMTIADLAAVAAEAALEGAAEAPPISAVAARAAVESAAERLRIPAAPTSPDGY
jgi:hypothetical protein